MIAGLAGLRKRVERCAAADASFTLALETIPGGIRVVDARPEGRGPDADSGVACARSTLLGQIIPAASAVPGRQWQMALSVRSST